MITLAVLSKLVLTHLRFWKLDCTVIPSITNPVLCDSTVSAQTRNSATVKVS